MPRAKVNDDRPRDAYGRFAGRQVQSAREDPPDDLLAIRRAANALLPIHKVPYELISQIALDSIRTSSGVIGRPLRHMLQLTHIDSLWRDIVSSNPRLWEFVDSQETQLFLKLLPKYPTIRLRLHSARTWDVLRSFLEVISLQDRRWKAVELGPESSLDAAMVALISAKAEDLTALCVACHWQDADLHRIPAPNLRHIEVQGIAVEWHGLKGLLSLRIEDLKLVAPSIHQFVAMLASSKGLRWLHVENVQFTGMEDTKFMESIGVISLPYLSECMLLSLGEAVNHFIGCKIEAPQCRILDLDLESSSGITAIDMVKGPASPLSILTKLPMTCLAATIHVHYVAGTVTVAITTEYSYPVILWMADEFQTHINLTFDLPWLVDQWPSLAKNLSLPMESPGGLITFHPSQTQVGSTEDPFLDLHLDFWTSTEEIEFKSGFRFVGEALRQLTLPKRDVGGQKVRWTCPRLTTLIFDCRVKDTAEEAALLDGTLQVLQARNAALGAGGEGGRSPARLENIYGPKQLLKNLAVHFVQIGYDYGVVLGQSLPH